MCHRLAELHHAIEVLMMARHNALRFSPSRAEVLYHCRTYLAHHRYVTEQLGDIHEEIFDRIRQNGYTYEELKACETSRAQPLR